MKRSRSFSSAFVGLIAEEVAKINPELITSDEEGRAQTVRYEAINAMLLNEFLKKRSGLPGRAARGEESDGQVLRLQQVCRK